MDSARKGDEVCVKIEAVPGEAPKMFGRHFDETDLLISRVGFLSEEENYTCSFKGIFVKVCAVLWIRIHSIWIRIQGYVVNF